MAAPAWHRWLFCQRVAEKLKARTPPVLKRIFYACGMAGVLLAFQWGMFDFLISNKAFSLAIPQWFIAPWGRLMPLDLTGDDKDPSPSGRAG